MLLVSVKFILAFVLLIVIPVVLKFPKLLWPAVTAWLPKLGLIFVPCMAALEATFAFVTVLSAGSDTPKLLNVSIKKSVPDAGP